MSGWDWAIITVFVLEIVAIIAVVSVVLQIKNGPVAFIVKRTKALIHKGKALVATGQLVVADNRTPLVGLVSQAKELRDALRWDASEAILAGEPVNYTRLFAIFNTVRSVRGGLRTVQGLLGRGKAAPSPADPPRPARRSVVDRLGLLPPAAKHLGPAIRIAKMAVQTHRQLRDRGIL